MLASPLLLLGLPAGDMTPGERVHKVLEPLVRSKVSAFWAAASRIRDRLLTYHHHKKFREVYMRYPRFLSRTQVISRSSSTGWRLLPCSRAPFHWPLLYTLLSAC